MPKRRVVRTWSILGARYPVVQTDEVGDLEGEFDVHGEVRVNVNIPPHRFWEVESHELGHAVAGAMDMKATMQDFGLSKEMVDKLEELWISKFIPVYLDTLQRGCSLVPPFPPEPGEES